MAKWLYIVESNAADPKREAEYNEWYDKIHVPDVLEVKGFIRAIRYEDTEPAEGKGKFIAMYEIESDDIDGTIKALRDKVEEKRKAGRMRDDLVSLVARRTCKQISSSSG